MSCVATRAPARCAVVAGGLLLVLAGAAHAEVRPAVVPSLADPAIAGGGPTAGPEIVPAARASAEIVPARPRAGNDAQTKSVADGTGRAEAGGDAVAPGVPAHDPAASGPPGVETPAPARMAPLTGSNIRWPSTNVSTDAVEATGDPAAAASDAALHEAATGADPEITTSQDGAFNRALAAWHSNAGPRSQREAARWFRVAAEAGDRRAAVALAYLQGLGLGVARDPLAAQRSLQQASDAGVARADYLLSLLAAAGRRPGSERQQGEFRERAARRDDPVAQNAMGVHYQLQGDRATAEMWYRRAAGNGSPAARLNVAALAAEEEARQSPPDTVGGAGEDDADALFERARRHHRGEGVPVDYGQALQLYRQAAAKGSEPAQQMLGLIQSRSLPGGGFDPAWMRQLATAAVGRPGSANLVGGTTPPTPPRLDDPLHGLADIAR